MISFFLNYHVFIVVVFMRQFQCFIQNENRHVPKYPQVQNEVVNSVDNEHVQADVLDPVTLFDQQK